nr:MAG TPA: hypothetical protein [Bacteriophage sp.]
MIYNRCVKKLQLEKRQLCHSSGFFCLSGVFANGE